MRATRRPSPDRRPASRNRPGRIARRAAIPQFLGRPRPDCVSSAQSPHQGDPGDHHGDRRRRAGRDHRSGRVGARRGHRAGARCRACFATLVRTSLLLTPAHRALGAAHQRLLLPGRPAGAPAPGTHHGDRRGARVRARDPGPDHGHLGGDHPLLPDHPPAGPGRRPRAARRLGEGRLRGQRLGPDRPGHGRARPADRGRAASARFGHRGEPAAARSGASCPSWGRSSWAPSPRSRSARWPSRLGASPDPVAARCCGGPRNSTPQRVARWGLLLALLALAGARIAGRLG